MFMSDSNANDSESMEAIRSLVDFHDGSWKGKATSFSVTADTAAGIVNKKVLPKYKTSIKLGLGENGMTMTETFDFNDKISSRSVPLIKSNMDIDSVDGSYSLDISLPDIPSDVVGTEKLLQFGVEHCIAVNDDARARCLALYGVEGALSRVVVMHEERIESGIKSAAESTQEDLLAMSGDIDRIVDKIAGQIETKGDHTSSVAKDASEEQERLDRLKQAMQASPDKEEATLTLYPMSLLELSSGVWLGDSIVRDCKNVAASPYDTGSGFSAKRTSITSTQDRRDFANWEMGVQKNAWRWIWKLGDSIRQEDEVGKAMGSPMAAELAQSLSGILCVNESLSRRIPRDERMVYIDWDNGAYVGFILGPVSIQLPRYLTFDSSSTKKAKPFFTEFCVYQSASAGRNEGDEMTNSETNEETIRLPELCCSKIARVYNFEGKLKQGCTSFFTLRRL
jgi:hypothetical protein